MVQQNQYGHGRNDSPAEKTVHEEHERADGL